MKCVSETQAQAGYADAEFIAEEALVEIQPNFNMGEPVRFVSGEFGPFSRRCRTSVPLWLALYLERHGKCSIVAPSWLNIGHLTTLLREERERGTGAFTALNDEMIQVGIALLNREYLAGEYLGGQTSRTRIQSLVNDILLLRRAKTVEGLKQIDASTSVVDITNMTSVERSSIRNQGSTIMNTLCSLWNIRDNVIGTGLRGA